MPIICSIGRVAVSIGCHRSDRREPSARSSMQGAEAQLPADGEGLAAGSERARFRFGEGVYRDVTLHWDADRLLFAFGNGSDQWDGGQNYDLYEVRVDGTGLRRLTSGPEERLRAVLSGGWPDRLHFGPVGAFRHVRRRSSCADLVRRRRGRGGGAPAELQRVQRLQSDVAARRADSLQPLGIQRTQRHLAAPSVHDESRRHDGGPVLRQRYDSAQRGDVPAAGAGQPQDPGAVHGAPRADARSRGADRRAARHRRGRTAGDPDAGRSADGREGRGQPRRLVQRSPAVERDHLLVFVHADRPAVAGA